MPKRSYRNKTMKSYIIGLFYKKIILLTLLSSISFATQADLEPVININQNGKILYNLSSSHTDTFGNVYTMEAKNDGLPSDSFRKIIKLNKEGKLITELKLCDSCTHNFLFLGVNSFNEILILQFNKKKTFLKKWSTDGLFLSSAELAPQDHTAIIFLKSADNIVTYSPQGLLRILDKNGFLLKEITSYQDFKNPSISHSIANIYPIATNSNGQLLLSSKQLFITIDLNGKQLKPSLKRPILPSKSPYYVIMYDNQNNIYASVKNCNCLKKFDFNGNLLQTIGKRGSKPGQFLDNIILGTTDKDNNLIISDNSNKRIQKLQSNGQALWTYGDQADYFLTPKALAVDSQHNIYVTDNGHHRIQKFSANGILLKTWGSLGSKNNEFEDLQAINIDQNDIVYVEDTVPLKNGKFQTRTQSFSSEGLFIASDNKPIPSFDKKGNAYRAFFGKQLPDKTYEVILQKTDSSGLIQEWRLPYHPCSKIFSINSKDEVVFTVCAHGNNYFNSNESNRTLMSWSTLSLNKFDTKTGKIINTVDLYTNEGSLLPPANLAIDDNDNVYASNLDYNYLQGMSVFDSNLELIGVTAGFPYTDIFLKDNQINIIRATSYLERAIQAYKPISTLKAPILQFVKQTDVKGELELAWEDRSDDETGFKLQRCIYTNGVCSDFKTLALLKANTSSVRLVKPKDYYPGISYKFRVLAIKDDEESLVYNNLVITLN